MHTCAPCATPDSETTAIGQCCFEYSASAPRADINQEVAHHDHSANMLKEWENDVVVHDEDVWALTDLEEFDHSRLHRLLDAQPLQTTVSPTSMRRPADDDRSSVSFTSSSVKRPHEQSPLISQPMKRPKLDDTPLRSALPPVRDLTCLLYSARLIHRGLHTASLLSSACDSRRPQPPTEVIREAAMVADSST